MDCRIWHRDGHRSRHIISLAKITTQSKSPSRAWSKPPPPCSAARAPNINLLSGGRFRFGVGTGSTKADFDVVQADFDTASKCCRAYWR